MGIRVYLLLIRSFKLVLFIVFLFVFIATRYMKHQHRKNDIATDTLTSVISLKIKRNYNFTSDDVGFGHRQ